MRLFLIGGLATGIGLTLLAISIVLQDITTAFYAYVGTIICAVIVVIAAIINSLSTWAGYVHPDDRLWSNILAYLLTLFTILTFGRFLAADPLRDFYFTILFNTGSMLVLALILLFGLVGLSGKFRLQEVLEGTSSDERTKEISARLILFSLLIGSFMTAIQVGLLLLYGHLNTIFLQPNAFYYTSFGIGGIAFLLVISLGVILRTRYEPVSGSK